MTDLPKQLRDLTEFFEQQWARACGGPPFKADPTPEVWGVAEGGAVPP